MTVLCIPAVACDPLDGEQIRMLRRSARLIFAAAFAHGRPGAGTVRGLGWDDAERPLVQVPCVASVCDLAPCRGDLQLSHMAHSISDAHRTWMNFLHAGDRLGLRGVRSNQTVAIDRAGLVCDELHLQVLRADTDGQLRVAAAYLIAVQTGRDDSARMIRPPL